MVWNTVSNSIPQALVNQLLVSSHFQVKYTLYSGKVQTRFQLTFSVSVKKLRVTISQLTVKILANCQHSQIYSKYDWNGSSSSKPSEFAVCQAEKIRPKIGVLRKELSTSAWVGLCFAQLAVVLSHDVFTGTRNFQNEMIRTLPQIVSTHFH